jgi:hypothetical protein
MRAMTRSQRTFCSPSRVSKVIQPLSIAEAVVSRSIVIRPSASAASSALTLASLAVANSAERLTMVTALRCSGVGGEAERILDAGVAGADHDDMLVDIFAGIVELILDDRTLADRAADQVRIALGADGEDDVLGVTVVARFFR